MELTVEQRLISLENELAALKARLAGLPLQKDPWSTFGWAKNSRHFDDAVKAGEEIRRAATFEKEK